MGDGDLGNTNTPLPSSQTRNEAARVGRDSACTNEVRGGTWRRRCLEFIARAYGYASSGTRTPQAQYELMQSRGLVNTSKGIRARALVYFDSSDPADHVANHAGSGSSSSGSSGSSGRALSNDYVRPGCIDLTPMSNLSAGG